MAGCGVRLSRPLWSLELCCPAHSIRSKRSRHQSPTRPYFRGTDFQQLTSSGWVPKDRLLSSAFSFLAEFSSFPMWRSCCPTDPTPPFRKVAGQDLCLTPLLSLQGVFLPRGTSDSVSASGWRVIQSLAPRRRLGEFSSTFLDNTSHSRSFLV